MIAVHAVYITISLANPLRAELAPEHSGDQHDSLRGWLGNDAFALLRDGNRRSDDGATASLGINYAHRRDKRRFDATLGYFMFTERLGSLRTEWMRLNVSWAGFSRAPSWKDTSFFRVGVGVQMTGDLGGAKIQDRLHRLTPTTNDLTFATGLQSTATARFRLAPELSFGLGVQRRFAWLLLVLGFEGTLPVGHTGLVWVGSTLRSRFGKPRGFFVEPAIRVRLQRGLGGVFDFSGAPIDGPVAISALGLGWAEARWLVALRWERNPFGIARGFGETFNDESVEVTVGIALPGGA